MPFTKVIESGIIIVFKLDKSLNDELVKVRPFTGNTTNSKDSHPRNAPVPIVLTLVGIYTDFKFWKF